MQVAPIKKEKQILIANISLLPTGSTVVVQCEDMGPWTHQTIIRHGSEVHNRRCYKIRVIKTGCITTKESDT